MVYEGADLNALSCKEFLEEKCELIKVESDSCIEISIVSKEKSDEIAKVVCFLYNYNKPYNLRKKNNSIHIKSLGVSDEYRSQGFATYLIKEILTLAEINTYKHVTVHPCAVTHIISQNNLEAFYKKFTFSYLLYKKKKIIFKIILD